MIAALAAILPPLARWIEGMLAKGRDPVAEFNLMLDAQEEAALAAERAKFG